MFSKIKRNLLRNKLKRDKLDLLSDLLAINKKIKMLDEMDKKEEDKKGKLIIIAS